MKIDKMIIIKVESNIFIRDCIISNAMYSFKD